MRGWSCCALFQEVNHNMCTAGRQCAVAVRETLCVLTRPPETPCFHGPADHVQCLFWSCHFPAQLHVYLFLKSLNHLCQWPKCLKRVYNLQNMQPCACFSLCDIQIFSLADATDRFAVLEFVETFYLSSFLNLLILKAYLSSFKDIITLMCQHDITWTKKSLASV